jgi:hypothetical protein
MHVIDLAESSIGWKDKFPIHRIGKAYEVAKSIRPCKTAEPQRLPTAKIDFAHQLG